MASRPAWLKSFFRNWNRSPRNPQPDARPRTRRLGLESLESRLAPATFTEATTQLNIDLTASGMSLKISSINSGYTLTLFGDTWLGTNSANVTGNGTATLTVTTAGKTMFDTVNVSDTAIGNNVLFSDSTAAFTDHFNINLSKQPGTVLFLGTTTFSGSSTLTVSTAGTILSYTGSTLEVTDGALTLSANQQPASTNADFIGINVQGAIRSNGKGSILLGGAGGIGASVGDVYGVSITGSVTGGTEGLLSIKGQGGSGKGTKYIGVSVSGTGLITSKGADVEVVGIGGRATLSDGVRISNTAKIMAGGSGSVKVIGTGGTGDTSVDSTGVHLLDTATISSTTGRVTVTGIGGGSGNVSGVGVYLAGGTISTGGTAPLSITGSSGPSTVGLGRGVASDLGSTITTSGGDITITGSTTRPQDFGLSIEGQISLPATSKTSRLTLISDTINLLPFSTLSAPATGVAIRPRTAGRAVDVGGADSKTVLGLTDAELDRITAATLTIGDATTGPITVSAAITRPATTNVQLASAGAITQSSTVSTAGGTLRINANGRITQGPTLELYGLRFVTGGAFSSLATRDAVQVGFVPATGKAFLPLLNLPDGMELLTNDTGSYFMQTLGRVSAISGTSMLDMFNGTVDGDPSQKIRINISSMTNDFFGFLIDSNQAFTTSLNADRSFTPSRVFLTTPDGVNRTDTSRVEMEGMLGFASLNGAGALFYPSDTKSNRLVGSGNGFALILPTTFLLMQAGGVDPAGKPLPVTFNVGGIDYQANAADLRATYIAATDSFEITGKATADFVGGDIDVEFVYGVSPIKITGGVISATKANITNLDLGGLPFSTPGLSLAIDTAARKTTITGTSTVNAGNLANIPKFFVGFGRTALINDGRVGPSLVITDGVAASLSIPITTFGVGNFNFSNLGTDKSKFMTADFDPATATFVIKGSSQNMSVANIPSTLASLNRDNSTTFYMNVGLNSLTVGGSTATGAGLRVVNGTLASFSIPVASFVLQANRNTIGAGDELRFTADSGAFTTDPLLARYQASDKLFQVTGTALMSGITGQKNTNNDDRYTTRALFGARGSMGLAFSERTENPSGVSFAIGDITWAGTTIRGDTLLATYNPTSKSFGYTGKATWLYGTQSVPVLPKTGSSGIASALEGFVVDGEVNLDGITLLTNNLPLYFQKAQIGGGYVEQLATIRGVDVPTASVIIGDRATTVNIGSTATGAAIVFEAGAIKKSTGFNPRLIMSTPFTVAGIQLSSSSGRIDFPGTPDNPTTNFVAQVGTATITIGDVTTQATVTLPLTLKSGGLAPGATKLSLNAVTIQEISFQTGALTALYSTTDRRYNFAGTGLYSDGINNVNVGGAPTNPQIVEERGVFKLIGFTPPPVDFTVAGVIIPTKGLDRVDVGNLVKFTGVKVVSVGGTTLTLKLGAVNNADGLGLVYDKTSKKVIQISADISGAFTVGGVQITASGRIAYNSTTDELNISGAATAKLRTATGPLTLTIKLGDSTFPGLVIVGGQVKSVQASITSTFNLYGVTVRIKDVGMRYVADRQEFGIYGSATLTTPAKGGKRILDDFGVSLGAGADMPGVLIRNGDLELIDVSLKGSINLYGINATPNDLRFVYNRAESLFALTGGLTVTLANKFTATVAFPGDGLLISTQTGEVQIRGLHIAVADVNFGVLTIHNLEFIYEVDDQGVTTITGSGELTLPLGIDVAATVVVVDNRLSSISFSLARTPGIPIGTPPVLYLTGISGHVENLNDLDNFRIVASITGSVGPSVRIFGQTRALVTMTGTIDVSSTRLIISGDVRLLDGILGSGNGSITIFFSGKEVLRVQASVRLYPGGVLRGNLYFNLDREFNVTLSANLGVYIPDGIKKIGGKSLGTLGIYIQIRPNSPREQSYARFNATVLKILDVQATVDFAGKIYGYVDPPIFKKIKFNFNLPGAREYIIPIGADDEPVVDSVAPPTIALDAVTAVSGTPTGTIAYTATTQLPGTTTIDLYADSDSSGYQGRLIASGIPFVAGQQTFTWSDLAAYASLPYDPSKPLYVYAVINDGQNLPVYTAYSSPIVPPDYTPSVTLPTDVAFGVGKPVVFSTANDNAIIVTDPLATPSPTAMVIVTLSVRAGTLTLSGFAPNVTVTGNGTGRLQLVGTAADITAAIDGLSYTPYENSLVDDRLGATIGRYPSFYVETIATTVAITAQPLTLTSSDGPGASIDYPARSKAATVLDRISLNAQASGRIVAATIAINGYEAGSDFLALAIDDQRDLGITATFDPTTGVLTLRGLASVDDYEQAIRRITFRATAPGLRSLTILASDAVGNQASFEQFVSVLPSNQAPTVQTGSGLQYTLGSGSFALLPGLTLADVDSQLLVGASIAIDPTKYVPVEDVLAFVDQNGITGSFDAINGILYLSGAATVAQYEAALQSVTYLNSDPSGTEGIRGITIQVDDGSTINQFGAGTSRILVSASPAALTPPTLDLQQTSVTASNDVSPITLAPSATITIQGPLTTLIGADIAITGNFQSGVDVLRVIGLPTELTSTYDATTGVLHIRGEAPALYYQYAIQAVTYANHATVRSGLDRTITVTIYDGFTTATPGVLTVLAPAIPVVDSGSRVPSYTQSQSFIYAHPDLTLDYRGQQPLTGAIVILRGDYQSDQDSLIFNAQNGITGQFDASTGTLTLTGSASVAAYQQALREVIYNNSRFNPVAGYRVVATTVYAGAISSLESVSLLNVDTAVVGPTVSFNSTALTFVENSSPLGIATTVSMTDPDGPSADGRGVLMFDGATIAIRGTVPGEDRLTFIPVGSITGRFDSAQGILFLTGSATAADYQAVLRSIEYENVSEAPTTTPRTLVFTVQAGASDLALGSVPVIIQSLNNPPIRTAGTITAQSMLQNARPGSLSLSGMTYVPPSSKEQSLIITIVDVPDASLGQVILADGTVATVGMTITVDQLRGARFAPTLNASGSGQFSYRVAGLNPILNQADPAALTETVSIAVNGYATANPSEAFVAQLYRDILGRNPEQSGLEFWANLLGSGISRSTVVQGIIYSEEARGRQVDQLYQSILGRAPSVAERQLGIATLRTPWNDSVDTKSYQEFRIQLLGSTEFYVEQGGGTNEGFVRALYQKLLGRDAEAEGLAYWTNVVNSGRSITLIAFDMSYGTEATLRDARLSYDAMLRRDPTGTDPAGQVYHAGLNSFGKLTQSQIEMLSSAEYYLRYASDGSAGTRSSDEIDAELIAQWLMGTPDSGNVQVTDEFDAVGVIAYGSTGFGSGTLIGTNEVLTAAHLVAGRNLDALRFTVGGTTYTVSAVYVHPNYDPAMLGTDAANDIAVLVLSRDVVDVAPIDLFHGTPVVGEEATIVGYGPRNGEAFGTRHMGTTPIDAVTGTLIGWTYDNSSEANTVRGDSGGAELIQRNGQYYLAGVTSGGTLADGGIGDFAYNTRVDAYLDWIDSVGGPTVVRTPDEVKTLPPG